MTTYNNVSNGSKREQLYKCGWLWQTGYYAKTKRKGGRGMRDIMANDSPYLDGAT